MRLNYNPHPLLNHICAWLIHFQLWVTEIEFDSKSQPNTFSSVFDSFHSILIINITDSINIEYTSLNGLESIVLSSSFLSSIVYQSISMACNLRTFNSHSFNRSWYINANHSSNILYMNCMQSVIMPKNHSCYPTKYHSLCTTIDSNGFHNKLQLFLQILVILVAIINSILHATQNKTFTRKWI